MALFAVIPLALLLALALPASLDGAPPAPPPTDNAALASATVMPLRNGANTVDLLGNGARASVFVARRKNFNAHGYSAVTFYIHGRAGAGNAPEWQLVPFFRDTPEMDIVRTDETPGCTLGDLRLVRVRRHAPAAVIVAVREPGASPAEAAPVRFDVYHLQENTKREPGWPRYYFQFERSVAASKPYCDVNDAFQDELKLGGPGVARVRKR
jgi:hypothetical protein